MSRGPGPEASTAGFRPSARRRNRIAAGLALGAAAIGGNLLVYSSLDDTTSVVQAVENIPAGAQVTAGMFRTVDVDVDSSVPTVDGNQLDSLVGQYAKVRIVSGQLVVGIAFQADPVVEPGKAIVAIEVDSDLMPTNVRERSALQLVIVDADGTPVSIPGTAAEVPMESVSGSGSVSLSVEVDAADAPQVATADVVSVVLLPPAGDEE
ncbi:SAF domain-containing protein [Ilumatobacter nonamiensis]|uniref:SAF domain-containing protein n=1 Tax=Ilumatobacter nonamiensis TaxID=467093 RepID=UPI000345F69B|nr:SAF domain-containing protein [Ilumatobacter nonamiensis]